MGKLTEARREIAPGVDIVLRGEGVKETDAVVAEVLCEMAAEAGGKMRFNLTDPAAMDELARRVRAKGVDPETGEWLC